MARILLVEDSDTMRDLLAFTLKEFGGHWVTEVTTLADAIAALEHDGPWDLVVLDLILPDRPPGTAFATAEKIIPYVAGTPVMVTSGTTEPRPSSLLMRFVPKSVFTSPEAICHEVDEAIADKARLDMLPEA